MDSPGSLNDWRACGARRQRRDLSGGAVHLDHGNAESARGAKELELRPHAGGAPALIERGGPADAEFRVPATSCPNPAFGPGMRSRSVASTDSGAAERGVHRVRRGLEDQDGRDARPGARRREHEFQMTCRVSEEGGFHRVLESGQFEDRRRY